MVVSLCLGAFLGFLLSEAPPASDRGFDFLGRPAGDAIAEAFRSLAAAEGGSR